LKQQIRQRIINTEKPIKTNPNITKPKTTPKAEVQSNPKPKPNVINSTTPGSTVHTDSAKVSSSIDSARIQQMPQQVGDSTLNNIKNEKKSRYRKLN